MTTNLNDLSARLKARTTNALCRVSLCLDQELVDSQAEAQSNLDFLQRQQLDDSDGEATDARLSGAKAPAKELRDAQAALDAITQAVQEDTVVFIFRRLTSPEYKAIVLSHTKTENGDLEMAPFTAELCSRSYVRTEHLTHPDVPLDLQWLDLVTESLSDGEFDTIAMQVIAHNRTSQAHPFFKRPSENQTRG